MISAQPVHARLGADGAQVREVVVDHGYRPRSIVARAGVPLRIVFYRRDDDPCMDRVVFSSPHLDRRLARDSATTVVLPAQPAGQIRFTCGMGRYHGQIELRSEATSLGPLRAAVTALTAGVRRGWRLFRGPVQPTVAGNARAIARARFARGDTDQAEFERAQVTRQRTTRETPS